MNVRASLTPLLTVSLCIFVTLSSAPCAAQTIDDEARVPSEPRLVLSEPQLRVAHDDHVVGRVFAELGMGVLAGLIGGTAGGFAGAGIGAAIGNESFFSGSGLYGGLIGHTIVALALIPATISWAGTWLDGRGDVSAAYLGELVGLALEGALIAAAFAVPGDANGPLIGCAFAGAILLPLFGAIAGYEISDDTNRANDPDGERAESDVQLVPLGGPTADGRGMTIGVAGTF